MTEQINNKEENIELDKFAEFLCIFIKSLAENKIKSQ